MTNQSPHKGQVPKSASSSFLLSEQMPFAISQRCSGHSRMLCTFCAGNSMSCLVWGVLSSFNGCLSSSHCSAILQAGCFEQWSCFCGAHSSLLWTGLTAFHLNTKRRAQGKRPALCRYQQLQHRGSKVAHGRNREEKPTWKSCHTASRSIHKRKKLRWREYAILSWQLSKKNSWITLHPWIPESIMKQLHAHCEQVSPVFPAPFVSLHHRSLQKYITKCDENEMSFTLRGLRSWAVSLSVQKLHT